MRGPSRCTTRTASCSPGAAGPRPRLPPARGPRAPPTPSRPAPRRHLSGTCPSEYHFPLGVALKVRNAYSGAPSFCHVLDDGPFPAAAFSLGYPLARCEFPRSVAEAEAEGLLERDASGQARLTSRDRVVTVTLHPSLLLGRATRPCAVGAPPGAPPGRHHFVWATEEFATPMAPPWLQPALALCVVAAGGAGAAGAAGAAPPAFDTVARVRRCLADWAPGALASAPRTVPLPPPGATHSRRVPGTGEPGALGASSASAASSWHGHAAAGSADGAWWRSPSTSLWPASGAVRAEWTPGVTCMALPVRAPGASGDRGPEAAEAVGVVHEDGSLLVTGDGGRCVTHWVSDEHSRLFLSDALPERSHARPAAAAPGAAPRGTLVAALARRPGSLDVGRVAARLLAFRAAGLAGAPPGAAPAGPAPLRAPSPVPAHPVPGRTVAYHRPGGGALGYPGRALALGWEEGARVEGPRDEALGAAAHAYFEALGTYRAGYAVALDGGVVDRSVDPGVGAFTAYADGRVHVVFADGAVLHLGPGSGLCRVITPGGERGGRAVSVRFPVGVEAYVAAALEYRGWAFLTPRERGDRMGQLDAVQRELSRIERHVALIGTCR